MGVVQIALEELHLGKEQFIGWYKLFNSDSLNSLRKESGGEVSSVN
jgi:hypothetical protein